MALDIITGVELSPRGGLATTTVTATGVGFGVLAGRVVFDLLGQGLEAAITLWQDDQVVFTVPAGLSAGNKFVRVTIERSDASDSDTAPFWLPDPTLTLIASLPAGLDYQWPATEAGVGENLDDPRVSSAADFNRMLDRVLDIGSVPPGAGDMLKAVYDNDDDGFIDSAAALDDGGTPRTYADIVALINSVSVTPRTDLFVASSGQTEFTLSTTPGNPTTTLVMVNGAIYTVVSGHFTVSGPTLTWLNPVVLDNQDRFEVYYFE